MCCRCTQPYKHDRVYTLRSEEGVELYKFYYTRFPVYMQSDFQSGLSTRVLDTLFFSLRGYGLITLSLFVNLEHPVSNPAKGKDTLTFGVYHCTRSPLFPSLLE